MLKGHYSGQAKKYKGRKWGAVFPRCWQWPPFVAWLHSIIPTTLLPAHRMDGTQFMSRHSIFVAFFFVCLMSYLPNAVQVHLWKKWFILCFVGLYVAFMTTVLGTWQILFSQCHFESERNYHHFYQEEHGRRWKLNTAWPPVSCCLHQHLYPHKV